MSADPPRTERLHPEFVRFPRCKGREVEARFAGGAITSNGGAVLLRQADRMLGLTEQAARVLDDPRRKASCRHSARSRRVIDKAKHAARGANPRYIVTSLKEAPQYLYDTVYCARGDMENLIKEQP